MPIFTNIHPPSQILVRDTAIKIDEAGLKDDLKTLIRGTVEDTLNAMLDEEAASLPLQHPKLLNFA